MKPKIFYIFDKKNNKMNITDSIAKKIGGEVEKIINDNPEIQFYANDNINEYQWRDSRFDDTKDVWKNPSAETRQELIKIFKHHLFGSHIDEQSTKGITKGDLVRFYDCDLANKEKDYSGTNPKCYPTGKVLCVYLYTSSYFGYSEMVCDILIGKRISKRHFITGVEKVK